MPSRKNSDTPPSRAPAADNTAKAADTGYNRSDSGPAHPPGRDNAPTQSVQKAAAVAAMAAGMPYNPTKAGEHGRDNALNPQAGATSPPPRIEATGSTLTEENTSDKAGEAATPGLNRSGNPPAKAVRSEVEFSH